MLFESDMCF